MPLSTGTKLGPYEILALIGKGGMGEVYRGRDTKLDREVAIKVLPTAFASDPERLARFAREAKVLASLNHAGIASIYGVEGGALVMEIVSGPALADRIRQGPIRQEETVDILLQIAEALEYAHERGIIHRDLKPANIKIDLEDRAKILDFGLAKAFAEPTPGAAVDPADSPTVTIGATVAGTILGTAAYMAPEQARGKKVDKRADIWAFGVIVWEMLTGEQLFQGEDTVQVLSKVLEQPLNLEHVPARFRSLLERCLERNPKERLRDIGDARFLLEERRAAVGPEREGASPTGRLLWPALSTLLAAGLMAVSWIAWRATRPVDRPLVRLEVNLGPEAIVGARTTVAISPDGRRIVFPTKNGLETRTLDQTAATLLTGTSDAEDPFFSPDGQWIGFSAGNKLKKISVLGGAPVTLCDAPTFRGASWSVDGYIVAALDITGGLYRVPEGGGTPQVLTKITPSEGTHRWPHVLPDGNWAVFNAGFFGFENGKVEAVSLKKGDVKTLIQGGYFARYIPTDPSRGHLLYLSQGVLMGVPFDPVRMELRGQALPLLQDVGSNAGLGSGQWDISQTGTMIYLSGPSGSTVGLSWMDASGATSSLVSRRSAYVNPMLAPDDKRLAVADNGDIHVYDIEHQMLAKISFSAAAATNEMPVWAPDGKHIVYDSSQTRTIFWVRADGSGEPQTLLVSKGLRVTPYSFSPDGRRLAFMQQSIGTNWDLYTVPLDLTDPEHPRSGVPELFLGTPSDERAPSFSPDGRWLAYQSNESGRFQVYVRRFGSGRSDARGKWQISNEGGAYPVWSHDGKQIFFADLNRHIMAAEVGGNSDTFIPGRIRQWSSTQVFDPGYFRFFGMTADGKRAMVFSGPETQAEQGSLHVMLLENFFDEVRRRVPPAK